MARRRRRRTRRRRSRRRPHRRRPIPFLKRRSTKQTISSFIAAVIIAFLAFKFEYTILQIINVFAWIVFSYFLYKGIYCKINRICLRNDLSYFAMRIVGLIILLIAGGFIVSFYLGLIFYGYDPLSVGILILIFGFAGLGLFMLFRTKRFEGRRRRRSPFVKQTFVFNR